MLFLLISLVALYAGYLALPLLRARPRAMEALDGLVIVSVGGLVLLHLWPHALEGGGGVAVLAALIGVAAPVLLEKIIHRFDAPGHDRPAAPLLQLLGLGVVLGGLLVHSFMDGAALALSEVGEDTHAHAHAHGDGDEAGLFALGVLLHQLPMGLALGWALLPRWGPRRALLTVTAMALATVVGFEIGVEGLPMTGVQGLAAFEAFVAGALLHVVSHHAPPGGWPAGSSRSSGALGALGGVGLLLGLELVQASEPQDGALDVSMLSTSLAMAPALLLAIGVKVLMGAGLPASVAKKAGRWSGRSIAALFASIALVGVGFEAARLCALALFGLFALLAAGRPPLVEPAAGRLGWFRALASASDSVLPWAAAGVALSVLIAPLWAAAGGSSLPPIAALALLALMGLPLGGVALGALPAAAALIHVGAPFEAALAFVVAASIRWRAPAASSAMRASRALIGLALALAVGLAAQVVDLPSIQALGVAAAQEDGPLQATSLLALAPLAAWSLLRRGPRGLLASLSPSHSSSCP